MALGLGLGPQDSQAGGMWPRYVPADDGDDDGEAYRDVLPHSRRIVGVGFQLVHPTRQEKVLAELKPVEYQVEGQVRNLPALPQKKMTGAVRRGWIAHSGRGGGYDFTVRVSKSGRSCHRPEVCGIIAHHFSIAKTAATLLIQRRRRYYQG